MNDNCDDFRVLRVPPSQCDECQLRFVSEIVTEIVQSNDGPIDDGGAHRQFARRSAFSHGAFVALWKFLVDVGLLKGFWVARQATDGDSRAEKGSAVFQCFFQRSHPRH